MIKAWEHFKTITHHKLLVMEGCFKVGLFKQGLLHDLSKYSPSEFMIGAKYWQGDRSPNNAEREAIGYSSAWLHHKGRNKHHYEYWIDYSDHPEEGLQGMRMPNRYVVEMFCDRMAASKNYNRDTYTDDMPLNYYNRGKDHYVMHPETRELLFRLLTMLAQKGETETFRYIREEINLKE